MQFFIPQVSRLDAPGVYRGIADLLKSQLRLPILERQIYSLSYTNSKKKWFAQVGELEQNEHRYEIVAIFESKQYIVYTRAKTGGAGPIILVDKAEVTAVEDFESATKPEVSPGATVA